MKRAIAFQKELAQINTIEGLTSVFESIASLRIAQIKDKVESSSAFFNELWKIYTALRVDPQTRMQAQQHLQTRAKPQAFIVVTSEGGLSGDIDQRIVERMLKVYDPAKADVIVIGAHGANQLAGKHLPLQKYFRLPDTTGAIDVGPIIDEVIGYSQITCFYQTYVSLMRQDVAQIDLISAVKSLGESGASDLSGEIISSLAYLFEPSIPEVIDFMESVMMEIALSQVILESKLAQFASRFNAMSAAKNTAHDMLQDELLLFHRAKRAQSDERLKEIINSMLTVGDTL
jgi:ATP synthase F1 gamma subunit